MSKSSTNNCKNQCKVISKYFSSSPVMDESFSEFKEKKKGHTGPRNSQKPVNRRTAKKTKRIKGQKDIRTALKSNKNELVAYTEKFNDICKESGIDVDTEQLQLAIALSKSVQPADNDCSSSQGIRPVSSQERRKQIRTTLKEYGFAVPEVKTTKRQKKKVRKSYKLILTTDEEKQQIISDKYSQILFENVCNSLLLKNINESIHNKYDLSTCISYSAMKNNDVLYVENLIEKSSSNGCLLRDWIEIPGRPQSPKSSKSVTMNFSEIECSQEELDVVLSGTIKSAKSIVHSKVKTRRMNASIIEIDNNDDADQNLHKKHKAFETIGDNVVNTNKINDRTLCDDKDMNNDSNSCVTIVDRVRSCSPDIFDDEESTLLDSNKSYDKNCQPFTKKNVTDLTNNDVCETVKDNMHADSLFKKNVDGFMDLTKAETFVLPNQSDSQNNDENNVEQKNDSIMNLTEIDEALLKNDRIVGNNHVSHSSNFTKRNSNDFMEITKCVAITSELASNNIASKSNVSQLQNKTRRMTNDLMEITDCVGKLQNPANVEDIDLTQNSDDKNDVTSVNVEPKVVDLSQSSNSEDELPFVQISGSNNHSLDDTILLDNNEITTKINTVFRDASTDKEDNANVELTESPTSKSGIEIQSQSVRQSFFDEFVYDHSNEISDKSSISHVSKDGSVVDLTQSDIRARKLDDIQLDLTQSSNSSDGAEDDRLIKTTPSPVKSSLGKKDEVSVDYDELFDNITAETGENSITNESAHYDHIAKLTNSRNSEVFDISDKELEYSLNKSRKDFPTDVSFKKISLSQNCYSNLSRVENNSSKTFPLGSNQSMDDSYLPMVNIKKYMPQVLKRHSNLKTLDIAENSNEQMNHLANDPHKKAANESTAITPSCSKYVVKTDQVTPMMDYASMSTPERNKELDKYGLKPFKRKRAIQLLTHLYNQTHPIVESCPDLPSPSKKRRYSSQLSPIKPLKSPNTLSKSPGKSMKSPGELTKSPSKLTKSPGKSMKSPGELTKSPSKLTKSPGKFTKPRKSPTNCNENELQSECNEDENKYQVTDEIPDVKDIHCLEEDWIFQKREKAKLHSCRVPLHVAFHNYVSCRRKLREAILQYEPVNIDVIHKELVASGHRYDPKDLLKYMDKKCITVKTADNNSRNSRR